MTYIEFLNRIDEFLAHVVEFTFITKWDGSSRKTQRYIWDIKEFGEISENSSIEIVEVKDLGLRKSVV